nr:response regulator [uncultured Pedobacter sp.]
MNKQPTKIKRIQFKISGFRNAFMNYIKADKTEMHTKNPDVLTTDEVVNFIPRQQILNTATFSNKPTILLVEDNEEVRACIKAPLELKYQVYEAENGIKGLEIANDKLPNLIISDVMMPEMDGLSLCAKIKANENTSHIPVILLTGNVGVNNQVCGLKNGADIYLTKPFNIQVLLLNVQNLLSLSENMQHRFAKRLSLEPSNVVVDIKEEEFIHKVLGVIEDNVGNTEFGVHHLAAEIGMSSPVFYKKIQFLTGMSVNDFMKSIKLKRAAQLLKVGCFTVYQVAYEVGFKDSKYFSREFRKQFGCSPSEYSIS